MRTVSKKRVVLAGYYPPPFAGEPIHVKQLAGFLRAKGMGVEILNLRRGAPPSKEYRNATGLVALLALLFRLPQRSSIFHFHTNGHNWKSWVLILLGGLAGRVKRARTILTLHSGLLPRYVRGLGRFRAAMARQALTSFVRIVCVNQDIAAAVRELGIERTRVGVIPAFLGVAQASPVFKCDELAIQRFGPLLVVVGGGDENPELGLPIVVGTLPDLIRLFPRVGAVFIGWGVGPQVTRLVQELGLTDHAICLGEVSHERCLALLGRADVVVRSTFADGDAITVREALALGVPVVASDTNFRPEGTTLFRKGDGADLLRKLIDVLSQGRRLKQLGPEETGASCDALWRVYCEVDGICTDASGRSKVAFSNTVTR